MKVQLITRINDFIHEVARQADITEIISAHCGEPDRHNKWSCPFHSEKTPSFSVKHNRFKCFGCGINGDSVEFVAKLENLTPYKAALKLNSDLGLNIRPPTAETSQNAPVPKPKERPITQYDIQKYFDTWVHDNFLAIRSYRNILRTVGENFKLKEETDISEYQPDKYFAEYLSNYTIVDGLSLMLATEPKKAFKYYRKDIENYVKEYHSHR